ncbi:MAG: SoxR reducing system RseC family protein [Candidatus Cloacimonetes bacterium]|nr:SoxR reducing system RseC family protein [Candidatus Cloacimonadota bacterium]
MNLENEITNEIGIVVNIKNNFAFVEVEKDKNCTNCQLKSLCFYKGNEKTIFKIINSLNAKKGDKISFVIEPKIRIFISFLIYIVPIIFLITTYSVCKYIFNISENLSIILAIISIPLCYFILKFIDKLFARKKLINPKMIRKI